MILGTDILCFADAAVFCLFDRNASNWLGGAVRSGEALPLLRLAHRHFSETFPHGCGGDAYCKWAVATIFMQLLQKKPITAKFLSRLATSLEYFYIPEAYPCPGGIPDMSKFPSLEDLASADAACGVNAGRCV